MAAEREPLYKTRMLNRDMMDFLRDCVREEYNIIVCGLPRSGRTAMLNLLASYVPVNEPMAVIEDKPELKLPLHTIRQQVIGWVKDVNRRKTVKEIIDQSPGRIILGDCTRGEAYEMLRVMASGHSGSMATIQAYNVDDLLNFRLPELVASTGFGLKKDEIKRLAAEALDLVIQMWEQRVEQICRVLGTEKTKSGLTVLFHPLYQYDPEQEDWVHQPLVRPAW
ncbi:MAG: ATPase, T2SS/T4P/T4SS family [Syntrophomonadaceae bacterium]|nr:ATPase, T2SS/T4P/T4SS family [Syntrophomonadaceae bacterium]